MCFFKRIAPKRYISKSNWLWGVLKSLSCYGSKIIVFQVGAPYFGSHRQTSKSQGEKKKARGKSPRQKAKAKAKGKRPRQKAFLVALKPLGSSAFCAV